MYVKLTVEQIISFHDEELSQGVGLSGIKDKGHLELIAEKPFTELFGQEQYPNLFLKAAVLMHGLITSHCFNDCNKRTAVVSTFAFLYLNKQLLEVDDEDLFRTTIKVAKNGLNIFMLAKWIEKNCKAL